MSLILLTSLCVLLPMACSAQLAQPLPVSPSPTPTSQRGIGGTLRLIYWEAPTILNPHLSTALKDWEAARITYEPLASYNRHGELVPFLAAEIPTLENGDLAPDLSVVTWRLKRGVQWSDGEPFTADDVLFTYEYVKHVNTYSYIAYEKIEEIRAPDDYTVIISFKQPDPEWMLPFTGRLGLILPEHIFAEYLGESARNAPANWGEQDGDTVGTGPYRVVSFKPQEVLFLGDTLVETNKIEYAPNEFFREPDSPYFSKVELHGGGTASEAARLVLKEGSAQFGYTLYVLDKDLKPLEEADYGRVDFSFGSKVHLLQLNHTDPERGSKVEHPHPLFSDKRVRQAFAHAIDRQKIADDVYGRFGKPTHNFLVTPAEFQLSEPLYEFDLDRAVELLDAAGWVDTNGNGTRDKDGVEMQVTYQSFFSPFTQPIQQIIKDDLREIGVAVGLELTDISTFFGEPANMESYYRFRADMQSFDIVMDNRAPGLHFVAWTCNQIPTEENDWAFFNAMRWCSPDYDERLKVARTELDEQQRREQLIALHTMLIEDVAIIPIVHVAQATGISHTLQGVDITPWDSNTWNIKAWREVDTAP